MRKTVFALVVMMIITAGGVYPQQEDETKGFATREEAERVIKVLTDAKAYISSNDTSSRCDYKSKYLFLAPEENFFIMEKNGSFRVGQFSSRASTTYAFYRSVYIPNEKGEWINLYQSLNIENNKYPTSIDCPRFAEIFYIIR